MMAPSISAEGSPTKMMADPAGPLSGSAGARLARTVTHSRARPALSPTKLASSTSSAFSAARCRMGAERIWSFRQPAADQPQV
jgi:hypothetical protein